MAEQPTPIRRPSPSTPHSTIARDFGDGTYSFGLTWAGMLELEEKSKSPLLPLLLRLSTNVWHVNDAPAVIRLGLIGGGLAPTKALTLVRDYVEARPSNEFVPLAAEVLRLALFGPPTAAEVEGADAPES